MSATFRITLACVALYGLLATLIAFEVLAPRY
jgi:hypothetical protein